MKRHSFIIILAAAVPLLASCGLEGPELESGSNEQPYQVQICSEIRQQPATRVANDGFCAGDEIGVYVVNYDADTPGTLKLEGNQADNVRFRCSESGEWVSDYDIFYKDDDTKVDIYGYYPYASLSSIESYAYDVAQDQSREAENGNLSPYESSDFLWAKAENVTPTSSRVLLRFQHIMSSARVRLSQGSGWANAAEFASASKDVLITNTGRKSIVNLATGTVTPEGDVPMTGIVPMNDNGEFRAIVVPQTIAAGKNLLVITIDGVPQTFTREKDTEYQAGKITTYDLSISKTSGTGGYKIELTGISITAWEADNVSHGDDAKEYIIVHNGTANKLEQTITAQLGAESVTKITNLKITGKLGKNDYDFIRDKMTALQRLNLKEVESLIDGVYQIPERALSGKEMLIKCYLPDKLERINYGAFDNTNLTGALQLPEGLKYVSGFDNTNITSVELPSTLEEIGPCAFSTCSSLVSSLSFPESLKKIGESAFCDSEISGNLIFPENLESIGSRAFLFCHNLSGTLSLPRTFTRIEECAFSDCRLTGTLVLPEGLEYIGDQAFEYNCFKGELHIPSGVKTIGSGAFGGTQFNGNLVLPSELVVLGRLAFLNCWRLSGTVTIPSNIEIIPDRLFSGCRGLEGIVINKNVKVIQNQAFENCYGLTSVVCEAKNPPTIAENSFSGVAKDNFTVEVPEESVNLYRNANYWSEFKRFAAHREFSISRSLLRSLNAQNSSTFTLRAPSSESWSVEGKPEWVDVTPSSGTGKADVTVTVNALAAGGGNRSGEISFLLDGKDYRSKMTVEQYDYQYGDGDLVTLQKATKGKGINVVLLGDCFDAKDISEGKYLQAMKDAYGYFFDIEPYLTYRDYFNVYGVFGLSKDSGLGSANTIRESRFGSQYTLNEGVTPDFETTFQAACLAPIDNDVTTSLILMIENSAEYAGLTYMWGDGSAVAVVPMSTDPAPYDFRGLVHHEAGGHGFGKLADEYVYYNTFIESCISSCSVAAVNQGKYYGFYDNISLSGNYTDVPWAHLIYDPQYSNTVDVYEGAFYHARGVYRSESTSCMNNNIPYYNAISRESIVRRIMKYAGEEFSFEDFKAKDSAAMNTSTSAAPALKSTESTSSSTLYQMPPKFMGEKPSFRNK